MLYNKIIPNAEAAMFNKIFKWIGIVIIATVCGLLFFRIYTLNHYPAEAKGIIWTETLRADYADGQIHALSWEPIVAYDNAGYFFSHQPIYIPDCRTLIITVRYNNSLNETLGANTGEPLALDVSLFADGTERIRSDTYSEHTAYGIYTYRRYVFEGVDLNNYSYLYLDVYDTQSGVPDYTIAPLSSLEIYRADTQLEEYNLTARDKRTVSP